MNETGKSVAGIAAKATAVRHIRFVQHDAGRRERRMMARALQAVGQFLDAELVADGRKRIRRAGRRIGRIIAAPAVDIIETLRLRVARFQVFIADRPVRRQAVGGAVRDEILFAQPEQRRPIHLGRAADKIMHAWLEWFIVLVIPCVFGDVAVFHEDFRHIPILFFAGQMATAFQDENPFAGRGQLEGERAAAGPAANDDNVVMIRAHGILGVSFLEILPPRRNNMTLPNHCPVRW